MGTCPECDADIEIDETDFEEMEIGDPWDCDSCGSHLRVATLDPLEFDIDDDDDEDADESDARGSDDSDDADDDYGDDDDDTKNDWDD